MEQRPCSLVPGCVRGVLDASDDVIDEAEVLRLLGVRGIEGVRLVDRRSIHRLFVAHGRAPLTWLASNPTVAAAIPRVGTS